MSIAAIAIVVVLVTVIFGGGCIIQKRSGRPMRNPLWAAFTLTAVGLLYGITGLVGYVVPRHNPFIDHPPMWVGCVVWPQVHWALAVLLVSSVFWWLGLRRLSR